MPDEIQDNVSLWICKCGRKEIRPTPLSPCPYCQRITEKWVKVGKLAYRHAGQQFIQQYRSS